MLGLTLTSENSHEDAEEMEKDVFVGNVEDVVHFYAFGENA